MMCSQGRRQECSHESTQPRCPGSLHTLSPRNTSLAPVPGASACVCAALRLYLLKTSLEDRVSVLLQNNSSITGLLASFDEHMNLILINAEETGHSLNRFFPLLVIRGDSIIFVTRRRFTSIT